MGAGCVVELDLMQIDAMQLGIDTAAWLCLVYALGMCGVIVRDALRREAFARMVARIKAERVYTLRATCGLCAGPMPEIAEWIATKRHRYAVCASCAAVLTSTEQERAS